MKSDLVMISSDLSTSTASLVAMDMLRVRIVMVRNKFDA